VLLQAVTVAYASEQKVLGNDDKLSEALATPDVAVETSAIPGGWTPYQNGKGYSAAHLEGRIGAPD
jgi:hypothetical protein